MPSTYTLIASNTLGSSAASVTFSSIPSTYTDLVVRATTKFTSTLNSTAGYIRFNGVSTGNLYSVTYIVALNGPYAVASTQYTNANEIQTFPNIGSDAANANVYTPWEIYIPSYTASQNKPVSGISFAEQNNTTGYDWTWPGAGLWRSTNAITSISLYPGTSNFEIGSSFFLYGIKNS